MYSQRRRPQQQKLGHHSAQIRGVLVGFDLQKTESLQIREVAEASSASKETEEKSQKEIGHRRTDDRSDQWGHISYVEPREDDHRGLVSGRTSQEKTEPFWFWLQNRIKKQRRFSALVLLQEKKKTQDPTGSGPGSVEVRVRFDLTHIMKPSIATGVDVCVTSAVWSNNQFDQNNGQNSISKFGAILPPNHALFLPAHSRSRDL